MTAQASARNHAQLNNSLVENTLTPTQKPYIVSPADLQGFLRGRFPHVAELNSSVDAGIRRDD